MIKLKSLIRESEEPSDSDQWDNWYEYIKYFDGEIDKPELIKLIKRFGLSGKTYFNGRIARLYNKADKSNDVYLEQDLDNETYSLIRDVDQWVYDVDPTDFGTNIDDIWSNYIDGTLKSMKQHPGKVYHYTTDEKWNGIRRSGKMVGSSGTGINNRGAHGIFTSTDPEEYASGTYGDVCLELDLERFKNDSGLPYVDLEYEPEVEEYLLRDWLMSTLELENRSDIPSDVSPYTIIVGHTIPSTYIRQIK